MMQVYSSTKGIVAIYMECNYVTVTVSQDTRNTIFGLSFIVL